MADAGVARLVADLDEITQAYDDPATVASTAAVCLTDALGHTLELSEKHRVPGTNRYRQHLIHVHPHGRYSIVSLVWRPGQQTPIHDHRCWCVVGVVEGSERETRYHLLRDDERQWLLEAETTMSEPGDVSFLVPPSENIHRVENASDGLAVSLHIYGGDIGQMGSSIDCIFDYPVVVEVPERARLS
jgi:predicted metal-dependent enzyme (double-stranded beta helix superfamily)